MAETINFSTFKEHFDGFTWVNTRWSALFSAFKTAQQSWTKNVDLNDLTIMKMSLTEQGLEAKINNKLSELRGKIENW